MAEKGGHRPRDKGIEEINSKADLARFIKKELEKPGVVDGGKIVGLGHTFKLRGRAERGSTVLSGTGGSNASVSVTHGLTDAKGNPLTPEQILITTNAGGIIAAATARDDTTFTLYNQIASGTYSVPVRNDWMVIA